MLSSRWRKAIRDLWLNRTRTFLVVLSIAVGIFGVGAVACSYSILMRELRDNYLATNPASATLWTDPFDDDFVEAVRDIPAVGEAEGRCTVTGRIQVGPGEWRLVQLFVINDFDDVRINIIEPEQGAWPPADRDILIERDALTVARADIGDTVFVKTPNGTRRSLRVAGSAYDLGQNPAGLGGTVYGYITLDTLEWLGEPRSLNELSIVVADNPSDKEHITGVAAQVEDWIERSGRTVYRTEIPTPGEHPFNDSLASLLFLQAAFGLLALFLSGFLVVNMISALLAQQIRQIGMMKAVGARARQIMGVYFGVVLMLGLLALVNSDAGRGVGREGVFRICGRYPQL